MYREEEIREGVLCYRNSPTGFWIQYTRQQLTSRIEKLKDEIEQLHYERRECEETLEKIWT